MTKVTLQDWATIVHSTMLMNRPEIIEHLIRNNAMLEGLLWEPAGKVTVPEFIEGRAKGTMKMKDGKIYRERTVTQIDNSPKDWWNSNINFRTINRSSK